MITINVEEYEKNFNLTLNDVSDAFFTIELAQLIKEEGANLFIDVYGPCIKALSKDVVATYFASWFGRVCAAFHYALFHENLYLELDLSNLSLQMMEQGEYTAMMFRMKELRGAVIQDSEREEVVRQCYEEFYGKQVLPLFQSVASSAGISVGILWGQLATRMYYLQDAWHSAVTTDQERARLVHDLDLLFNQMPAEVFGQTKNPFHVKFRMVADPWKPGAMMRVKSTCCLAYKTDTGHGYCYTCPRLKDTEREQKRMEIAKGL